MIWFFFDEVLGLKLSQKTEVKLEIPNEILKLVEKRSDLRKKGLFAEADKIRLEIESRGFGTKDLAGKTEIFKADKKSSPNQ